MLAMGIVGQALAATPSTIHGIVTEKSTGKPIRGAMITARKGVELTARFSLVDGHYDMVLPAGTYTVEVKAYGYTTKSMERFVVPAHSNADFSLTAHFTINQLSSAEIEQLLPQNAETRLIESDCIRCHGLSNPARGGNMSAATWATFLQKMTDKRNWANPFSSTGPKGTTVPIVGYDDRMNALTSTLEAYFGPGSDYFSPTSELPKKEQIQHPEASDSVLSATIHEFDTPTRNVGAHSILVDDAGNAWFSEIEAAGNKIGKFNWQTKTITEYALPMAGARPRTGVIGKDGLIWVPLSARGVHGKLVSLDSRTGKFASYDFPGSNVQPYTAAVDPDGNIWLSGTALLKFDIKTHQFQAYKLPIPTGTNYSETSWQSWHNLPGKPPLPIDPTISDVKVDSQGMVWCSIQSIGWLIRLDPKNGDAKTFVPPATTSIKGIDIDGDDNIWFAEYWGSFLGKYDQHKGVFDTYKPPTPFAMPYGVSVNRMTGDVWYSDLNGNFVSRFSPTTEKFDEVPFPTPQASPRFIGIDPKSGRVWFTEAMQDKVGYVEMGSRE